MNIYQSTMLYYPRQILKYGFSLLFPLWKKFNKFPKVLSIDETLDKLNENKTLSIARFGDGEFQFICDRISFDYQKYNPKLANELKDILVYSHNSLLVGLPSAFYSLDNMNVSSKRSWQTFMIWTYRRFKNLFDYNKIYYNAHITRPYNNFRNKSDAERYFQKIKQLWKDEDILLAEGSLSRLGMGNDLFSEAKSVSRVLCPARDAFDKIEEIMNFLKENGKNKTILIALGSTATVLAYRLSQDGFRALDIGNVDIEYEWFKRGATKKIKIQGKYVNEAKGGREVEDMTDEVYKSQIIKEIY